MTNAVIRTSRGGTEDISGGLTEEALSRQGPRDVGIGSRLGKLGRGPAGGDCESTELESVRTDGTQWAIQQNDGKMNKL